MHSVSSKQDKRSCKVEGAGSTVCHVTNYVSLGGKIKRLAEPKQSTLKSLKCCPDCVLLQWYQKCTWKIHIKTIQTEEEKTASEQKTSSQTDVTFWLLIFTSEQKYTTSLFTTQFSDVETTSLRFLWCHWSYWHPYLNEIYILEGNLNLSKAFILAINILLK